MLTLWGLEEASAIARVLESYGPSGGFMLALLKRCPAACRWWVDQRHGSVLACIGATVLAVVEPGAGREVATWLRLQSGLSQILLPEAQGADLVESGLLPPHRPPVLDKLARTAQLKGAENSVEKIRRAVPSDFERLAPLYGPSRFEVPEFLPFPDRFRLALATGRFFYVEREGKPVSTCHTLAESDGWAQVMGVITEPAWRGKGLARAVVAELCRATLAEGMTPHLHYEAGKESARKLYGSLGFEDGPTFMTVEFGA